MSQSKLMSQNGVTRENTTEGAKFKRTHGFLALNAEQAKLLCLPAVPGLLKS